MKKLFSFLTVMLLAGMTFAATYNTKVHTVQGGAELVAESGGTITIKSGGALTADSGSTVTSNGTLSAASGSFSGTVSEGTTTVNGAMYWGAAGAKSTMTYSGALSMNGALVTTTVDTGNGAVEAYAQNQALRTTDDVTHKSVAATYGVSGATLTISAAGDIAGQFTWGAAGTKSTGTVTGALSIPGALTTTTVNISGSGQLLMGNATSAQLALLAPGQAKGAMLINSDTGNLVMSTGTGVGAWVLVSTPSLAGY